MNGRLSRVSLRWRLMAVGLAGLAAALVVGGLLLYAAVSTTLNRATQAEARAAAAEIGQLADGGRLPEPVPVTGVQVVQILDSANRVVGGSATADRLTPIVGDEELAQLLRGASTSVPGSRAGLSGRLQVAAVQSGPPADRVTVVAAVPTADLDTSRRILRTLMLVFLPIFLLLSGLIAWRVIGSALRPVEALREGAERIGGEPATSRALSSAPATAPERLPVPPTDDEISALASTLNGMLDRLAASGERQRAFVADAAHELRSPLASLRTQLEVAARLGEGGALPTSLQPEVDRLGALVEDLLTLARAGSDEARPPTGDVDLGDLVAEVTGRQSGARVPVRVVPGGATGAAAPVVAAARRDLDRALGNLVDNAVRHARTAVRVSAYRQGPEVVITVSDDGNGISDADRERVFDRFARLDEARARDSGGTGLGLAITRELLSRNGARIWLEDAAPGVRAVVAFSVPQGQGAQVPPPRRRAR